jgi:hypothetical protein
LHPEQSEEFGLKLVIAKALAGQMNKVERGIETTGRALKHSACSVHPEARRARAQPLIAEHCGKTW